MRRRGWQVTATTCAVAVAAVLTALALRPGHAPPAAAHQPAAAPTSAAPVHVASTPPPAPRLDAVAPATPTAFVMAGPKFRIAAHVCPMPYVRPLDPPGEQHHTVCWVKKDFGVAPGNPSRGTSYVLGHAWAEDPNEVLNPMSELAMRQVRLRHPHHENGVPIYPVTNLDGYTITLRTPNGRLTYRVTRAFAVSKERAADVHSVMNERTPGRIVLITCGVRDGVDVDVNVIAYATLVRAVAAPA
ncbi:MAG TPA: sortase [Jatrophihabitantaceae bacterium]|jgi:hypothetical protein|nr:sortase [Jatrophihabitantaceae bacterium]